MFTMCQASVMLECDAGRQMDQYASQDGCNMHDHSEDALGGPWHLHNPSPSPLPPAVASPACLLSDADCHFGCAAGALHGLPRQDVLAQAHDPHFDTTVVSMHVTNQSMDVERSDASQNLTDNASIIPSMARLHDDDDPLMVQLMTSPRDHRRSPRRSPTRTLSRDKLRTALTSRAFVNRCWPSSCLQVHPELPVVSASRPEVMESRSYARAVHVNEDSYLAGLAPCKVRAKSESASPMPAWAPMTLPLQQDRVPNLMEESLYKHQDLEHMLASINEGLNTDCGPSRAPIGDVDLGMHQPPAHL